MLLFFSGYTSLRTVIVSQVCANCSTIISFVSFSSLLVSGRIQRALQLTGRRVVDNDDVRPALRASNRGDRRWKVKERWEWRHDGRVMAALPHAQCRQAAGTRTVGDKFAYRTFG